MINYDVLMRIANSRMDHPQVCGVLVSPRTFAEIRDRCQPGDAPILGRMRIGANEFVPDDVALGQDSAGGIVKIWKL